MTTENELLEMLSIGQSDPSATATPKKLTTFTLRKQVIEHPTFTLAIREMARLHQRGKLAGVAEGMLLVAQTGSGKTTALKYYERKFPRIARKTGVRIPVLRVDTPESPTVKTLAEAILFALGDPSAMKGTATAMTNRIIHFFKECGIELLLIDEFQHFYDGRRLAESRRVSDWLKNLINKVGIPVIIAGLPRSIAVINANPQLRRRFGAPHYMEPFSFDTREQQLEFRGILNGIQARLPMRCIDIAEPSMAQRFYYATHGLIDYIVKIIDDAVSRSANETDRGLTQEDFALAFRRAVWMDAPDQLNPFSANASLRLLTKPLEPFDVWDDIAQYTSMQSTKKPRFAGLARLAELTGLARHGDSA
jgi:hypothetical protein